MLGTVGFTIYLWILMTFARGNSFHYSPPEFWWAQSWTMMAIIVFATGVLIAQINARNWSIFLGILIWGMASFWLFKTVNWWAIYPSYHAPPRQDLTQYKTILISLLFPLVWGYLTPKKSLQKLRKRLINIFKWLRAPMF